MMLITLLSAVIPSFADDISLFLNGNKIVCDPSPVIENGRTLIPARALFEEMGAYVSWDSETRKVTVDYNSIKITMTIGDRTAVVSDKAVGLDVPPAIINGRTMIPLRFVGESIGATVSWDGEKRVVSVSMKNNNDENKEEAATPQIIIKEVTFSKREDHDVLSFTASGKYNIGKMMLQNPDREVFDIMGAALSGGLGWNSGYRFIALFQIALTAVLFCSLPLWQKRPDAAPDGTVPKALTLPQVFALPGAKEVMLCFFCYCALETTAGLWASSYLTLVRQVPAQTAASFASLFYIGITVGRGVCGFLTLKLSDPQMIRLGFAVLGVGVAALLLPGAQVLALAGLVLVGLGCAPIYPSIIHSTPAHFGAQNSQAVIGIQMSSAYVGNLVMPPLFGVLANNITPALFPFYLLVFLVLMALMHRQLVRKTAHA